MRALSIGLLLVVGLALQASAQVKITKVTDDPPYSGEALAKYCSNPNKHLIIETKEGKLVIQLFDKIAPNHVAQITKFASEGKYDGCTFHRCIEDFMIQGGDPNTRDDDLTNDGFGGMGEMLKAEFSDISHVRGICSMARTNDPNSATSQFFICHGSPTFLDKQYTVWGQLLKGYDVMDKIMKLPRVSGDNPGKAATMTKVYIEEIGAQKSKSPKK
ncbi:MAG: peptidylprolyl isomerase [bacterium]